MERYPFVQTNLVGIAVNTGQASSNTFTYKVPSGMQLQLGQAVYIPFGHRILQGIVLTESSTSKLKQIREISAIADPNPVLDTTHRHIAQWMNRYYVAPIWECVATCLPAGYGQKSTTTISPIKLPALLPSDPKDAAILNYLAKHGKVSLEHLRKTLGSVPNKKLEELQKKGTLTMTQGLTKPGGQPLLQKRVQRLRTESETLKEANTRSKTRMRSPAARLLKALATTDELTLKETRELGVHSNHLRQLEEEDWISVEQVKINRDPVSIYRSKTPVPPPTLTKEQQKAVSEIVASDGKQFLLHGVTGSGKTEVYQAIIRKVLDSGKSAIVLVPEISLTPQAIKRYGEKFPNEVTVLHSNLSTGELYDQWHRINENKSRLIIGSRSAIFAPIPSLGLVVIDEEHEWTYKQKDQHPRYHTRDIASEICRYTGATLVLGSATPDITSYHRSEIGEFKRLNLTTRISPSLNKKTASSGKMPNIKIIDMREEMKAGNRSIFSYDLVKAVNNALTANEQSILFVNRRGLARFMLCRGCGHVTKCSNCLLSMGIDAETPLHEKLHCYHCNRSETITGNCPQCGSNRYRPFGIGTSKVEQQAQDYFPHARIARWDSTTVKAKTAHEQIVKQLEQGEIDILVGTQMLAKGLDLPTMRVVGVVDADVGLNLPDYMVYERNFQVLAQVAGRAGRREEQGEVFIQTYNPEARSLTAVSLQNYELFYTQECAYRRLAGYPPFQRITKLTHRNRNRERGLSEANRVASTLRTLRDTKGKSEPEIIGPTIAHIVRQRGEYQWQLLLKGREPTMLLNEITLGTNWSIEVDPGTLL